MFQILLCNGDTAVRTELTDLLLRAGYAVYPAASSVAARRYFTQNHIDLVISGSDVPGTSGLEITEQLRAAGFTRPILLLSEGAREAKAGLRAGADDVMNSPPDPEELLLRIDALFRRARLRNAHILRFGRVELLYDELTVCRGDDAYVLPRKEFQLLYLLLSYPSRVFTRDQLMDEIWGPDSDSICTTVNVHINRLRARFSGWQEFEIVTVRGLGYKAVVHTPESAARPQRFPLDCRK